MLKNIRYMYIIAFFHSLMFAYVIERLFAFERGMNVQLVVYTEIIYAIVITLFVVPSGIFADKFGRKPLLVVSSFFICLEFAVLIPARGFALFGLSALIAGFAGSFMDGTWNSILYDSLLSCKKQDKFEKIIGQMEAITLVSALIAGFSGGFLASIFELEFNYWISVGSAFIAFLFTIKLTEPPKSENKEKINIREIILTAIVFFKTNINVLKIIINAVIIAAIVNYIDEFWQVYLNDIAFPLFLFGVVSAGLIIVQIPGALLADKLLKRFTHKSLIILISFLVSIGIIFAAFMQNIFGLIGIALVGFANALIEPVAEGYLHHHAKPASRATIDSVKSMIERVFSIGIGLLFGYISNMFSIFAGFWFLGCLGFLICIVFLYLK